MIPVRNGELESPSNSKRLPSLLALRCFEAAARHENFTRAAHELSLTHGAVSRAVRLLEDDLCIALFVRRSRRVFLTESGHVLARAVAEGFDLMQQAVGQLRANARHRQWVLSCEPTLLMRWLIPRWPQFKADHPHIDVLLVAGGGAFSFSNGIDFAIRRDDFPWPQDAHSSLLFNERIGPVCRPDKETEWFSKSSGNALLENSPLTHTRTRMDAWQKWASIANPIQSTSMLVDSQYEQVFEHFYFSLQAAVAGLGVAMGPWNLVRDDLDNGLLTAPLGFVEDGTGYYLLSAEPFESQGPQAKLCAWLSSLK
ncbi:LysR family transcriptional regulator [Cobetia sp. QF-1]|uniref:LysR family transcriptional regulator n=1 Tax=Cobetia sp. QF-1 TaxID=1969833 RepID=UPI000B5453B8|nr:LysR family transcriptional regulator [Cobetia sp. QF-1]